MFGTTGVGADAGASAGVAIGLLYRAGSFGASWDGRAGGIGSGDKKIGSATMDVGVRYYLSSAEFAPFLGGGMGISYFNLSNTHASDMSGSGFGGYVQIGAEAFRTHHTGFNVAVRADLPFYKLASESSNYSSGQETITSESAYVVPLSFNVGIIFH
jgi:outer membrane protein W